jgi:hypothetical protein
MEKLMPRSPASHFTRSLNFLFKSEDKEMSVNIRCSLLVNWYPQANFSLEKQYNTHVINLYFFGLSYCKQAASNYIFNSHALMPSHLGLPHLVQVTRSYFSVTNEISWFYGDINWPERQPMLQQYACLALTWHHPIPYWFYLQIVTSSTERMIGRKGAALRQAFTCDLICLLCAWQSEKHRLAC